jgi:cell division septum initiation protein DivIVA
VAFVIGLAVASRMAHRRLREMEQRVEPQLAAAIDHIGRLTSALSTASGQVRLRAHRIDAAATRLGEDLRGLVEASADRAEGMAEGTENLAARVAGPSQAARRRFGRALAVVQGLRRGLAVWRGDDGP